MKPWNGLKSLYNNICMVKTLFFIFLMSKLLNWSCHLQRPEWHQKRHKTLLTYNFHDEDCLRVGRWLAGLLLLLELGEGAEDEGEGGDEDHAQGGPGEHLDKDDIKNERGLAHHCFKSSVLGVGEVGWMDGTSILIVCARIWISSGKFILHHRSLVA